MMIVVHALNTHAAAAAYLIDAWYNSIDDVNNVGGIGLIIKQLTYIGVVFLVVD